MIWTKWGYNNNNNNKERGKKRGIEGKEERRGWVSRKKRRIREEGKECCLRGRKQREEKVDANSCDWSADFYWTKKERPRKSI